MSSRFREKSLIVPINSKQEIFIQDRRGHKPPPWGFFGGAIEEGETAIETVIRESKEELDLNLTEKDLIFVKRYVMEIDGQELWRNLYLYPTEQESFTVLEGAGGKWVSFAEAFKYLERIDMFEKVIEYIKQKTT